MRKSQFVLISLLLTFGLTFAVMAGGQSDASSSGAAAGNVDEIQLGGEGYPAFKDIVFPDSLPSKPPIAGDGWYAYDNLDARYSIELLLHNYGQPALPAEDDPVNIWMSEKFNMDITFTTVAHTDQETVLTTRFAAGDVPDVCDIRTRELGFAFSASDLLIDAKNLYPLMPQRAQYATKNMIIWSTNKENGQIPFVTQYGIQDGVWGWGIRKDWLEKFGMDEPTTKAEVLEYARRCVEDDPDGNGEDDTYFMSGAGSGKSWGMLGGWLSMFGNPSAHVEDGQLVHPVFDGTNRDFLMFLNELYEMEVFAPDWFTIEWNKNKSYTMNDRLGMVWYPVGALYAEYSVGAKQKTMESLDVWHYWATPPIEGGLYGAAGNPGYKWAFAAKKFQDAGKVMRVSHMLDSMTFGGKYYFHSIQGSIPEVFENAGIEYRGNKEMIYTPDNNFFIRTNPEWDEWWGETEYNALGPWQHFGLCVKWQWTDPENPDPYQAKHADRTNTYAQVINAYERWPNDNLLITLDEAANEAQIRINDWNLAQEFSFVVGERSFGEWDMYQEEWLDKGGREIVRSQAESFGVPVPDYAR